MDLATIFAIVQGSVGIAIKCATVIKDLNDLAQKQKQAKLAVLLLVDQCQTLHIAWERIRTWTLQQGTPGSTIDEQLVERLDCSVQMGLRVLSALEEDVSQIGDPTAKFGFLSKSRVIWNEQNF